MDSSVENGGRAYKGGHTHAEKLRNVAKWLRNGCDPLAAATELAIIAAHVADDAGYARQTVDALSKERDALAAQLAEAERERRSCPHCGMSLAACYDAKRAGKIACCPDCQHDAALERTTPPAHPRSDPARD